MLTAILHIRKYVAYVLFIFEYSYPFLFFCFLLRCVPVSKALMQRTMNRLKHRFYHTSSHSNTPYVVQRVFIYHSTTVEPGYNDIGLCNTVYGVRYSVVPINSSLLTITLYPSVITTLGYNGTEY
jgi:hypothetical protein